jgi:hypothetical protein
MLTLMEGFDHEDLTTLQTKGWAQVVGSGNVAAIVTGRITGSAWQVTGNFNFLSSLIKSLPSAQTTTIFGFAVYIPSVATSDVFTIGGGCTIEINSTAVRLKNAAGTVVGTGSTVLSIPGWHYIEGKIVAAGASGTGEVHLNGAAEIAAVTSNFGSSHTNVQILSLRTNWGFTGPTWDDVYVCDGTGSLNNNFLGDCHVETVFPNGDGAHSDWTPSSGTSHAAMVDEVSPDGDTTYNGSATVNAIDTYTMNDLAVIGGTVFGLQVVPTVRKDDPTLRQVAAVVRRGGADYVGTTRTLSTSYAPLPELRETDPSTSAAWTVSGVNAAEFGTKVIT